MYDYNWADKINTLCKWVYKLVILHVIWILFSLLGLIVLGVFPATIAMFTVIRKWVKHDIDYSIFEIFLDTYKTEFWKGNGLGYILLFIGGLLYLDFRIVQSFENTLLALSGYFFLCMLCLFAVVMLYVFPTYAHFQLSMFGYIKQAFLMTLINPPRSLVLFITSFAILVIMTQIPIIFAIFGISILAFVTMRFTLGTYYKVLEKEEKLLARDAYQEK